MYMYIDMFFRNALYFLGLAYLHDGCNETIIHRDVKSSNILLSHSLEAKISDFGISKLKAMDAQNQSTKFVGSLGYIDPLVVLLNVHLSSENMIS